MTPPDLSTAPQPVRVKVICICCGAESHIWITEEEIKALGFVWLPLDYAYSHTCGRCLYQTVPADAPLPHQRNADPERAQHSQRTSGAYHTAEWRVTP